MLIKQLAPYMQARVETIGNIAPQNRERILDGYNAAIEAATSKAVPELAKAKRRLTQAQKSLDVVNFNANQLRSGFAVGTPAAYRKPILVDPRPYDPDAK